MATILRHIVDEIQVTLKQTMDDKKISRANVVYWVLVVGNQLKSKHVLKRSSGAFLSTFTGVPVLVATSSANRNLIAGRKYVFLPSTIFDFNNDKGIDYIAYDGAAIAGNPLFSDATFTRTTPKISKILYGSKYEKPSGSNVYYYRIGDYIYFLGLEKINVSSLEFGLYTALDPIQTIDIDQPFDFPDELLDTLKRQVIDLGRFSLLMPSERKNDGDDEQQINKIPTQKLTSVQPESQDAQAD